MLLWLLLVFTALVTSNDVEEHCASCIKVNNFCYNVTYQFDIDAPYRKNVVISQIGILRSSNTLFFSFEPNITDKEYTKVGFISLTNPSNVSIISANRPLNFGTFDIDQDNNLIYLGGTDGVYVLDMSNNIMSPYSSRGDKVLNVFRKDFVFFLRDDEFNIVKKKGDNFETVLESMRVKKFVINRNNVIVFISAYGLFASKKNEMVTLSSNPFFRGLVIDLDDTVYAWWVDGIYQVTIERELEKSKITKIATIPQIGALTFDNDNNFMYTSDRNLYVLIGSNNTLC